MEPLKQPTLVNSTRIIFYMVEASRQGTLLSTSEVCDRRRNVDESPVRVLGWWDSPTR